MSNCGTFPNCCDKFYSIDSLSIICDDATPPPPYQTSSNRFYGERISNKITNIRELGDSKQVKIYPNPCNDILNIECKILNEEVQLIIIDMLGREIKNEDILVDKEIKLNVSDLKKGVYFMQFRTSKTTLTRKLIKN